MTAVLLAFGCGVLVLQLQPELPAAGWVWAGLLFLPGAIWRKTLRIPVAFAIGFCWALVTAHVKLADRLAPELEGRDIEVVGVVAGLPATLERGLRFEFEPEHAEAKLPAKILLSWYRSANPGELRDEQPAILSAPLHPGERWRFTVRLRRPHGNANPHGFDYEAWLLERGVGATGYVRPRTSPVLLGKRNSWSDRIEIVRETVRDRFKRVLGETPASGILAALAVGDQRAISAEEWRLFSRTGVTHLMSISGLHVTMVSGLFAWLAGWLWRRSPFLMLRLPARKAAALAAIAGALGYSLLAGFAVPAQRTFWMVTVVALALWAGRIAAPARTLALALAVVLVFDPWAVLSPGFWLSFGAVALIFLRRDRGSARVAGQWLRVQWAITLGLAPAALFLFAQVSIVGPLANAVAIPLVSAVVTPLALLAAVLPWDALLELAAWLLQWLLQFLEWCANLPAAVWQQHAPPLWSVLLALAGVAWLLAPRGLPWRATGLALLLPAIALPPPAPAPGEAWITTLDVGQGLAVLVRTANRTLLYDAGPAFGRDRQRRAHHRALPARHGDRAAGRDGDHAQRHRPRRRRRLGGGELRSRRAAAFAAGGPPAAGDGGRRAALRGRRILGMGRRALRRAASRERGGARAQEQRPELRAESDGGRSLDAAHRRHRAAGGSGARQPRCRGPGVRRAAGAAPWQPDFVQRRIPRRRAACRGSGPGRLPQPLRPSECGGCGALPRCRDPALAHRPGGGGDGSSGERQFRR